MSHVARNALICLSIFAFAIFGCATSPPETLDAGAKSVTFANTASSEDGYEYVGKVRCSFGLNARPRSGNEEACRNKLRNDAAKMDADTIVIESRHRGCNNCIEFEGKAYRKQ